MVAFEVEPGIEAVHNVMESFGERSAMTFLCVLVRGGESLGNHGIEDLLQELPDCGRAPQRLIVGNVAAVVYGSRCRAPARSAQLGTLESAEHRYSMSQAARGIEAGADVRRELGEQFGHTALVRPIETASYPTRDAVQRRTAV
jgi:hypothetical protein